MAENPLITKEAAEKFMEMPGQARGIHFKNDADFILAKHGRQGLEMVEIELESLGQRIKYNEVKNLEFYPAGLRAISILAAAQALEWTDEDVRNLGRFASRTSFVVRLYVRFFYSIYKTLEKVGAMWREYWSIGKVSVKKHDEMSRTIVLQIEDLDLHPLYCRCLEGYFEGVAKMVTNAAKTECREIECVFSGGKGHEFEIKY